MATKLKRMPAVPDRLKAFAPKQKPKSVDREAGIIRGYVVAQLGPFKSDGRGEFDEQSLQEIVSLWPSNGLKSRFTHPTESNDGLGKHLGRAHNPQLSTVTVDRDGKQVEVPAVRADLHFAKSAFRTPNGDLASYVMDLAEEDGAALSSSLVLRKKERWRRDKDGVLLTGPDGIELPPLWTVTHLFGSDVVDEGDAVDGFLSVGNGADWTRDTLAKGNELLDKLFSGQTRSVVRTRCEAFLNRYLNKRYGVLNMDMLGKNLGALLTDTIDGMADDSTPREVIMADMAAAAEIEIGEVSGYVAGTNEADPPASVLEAFASVLGLPLSELIAAAEADGADYSGATESEDTPADAPPADAPPADMPAMAPLAVKKRKLQLLKMKSRV